jgi:hypothetical protein
MALHFWQFISVCLAALVTGVFWGPWLGLSRSIDTFAPEVFLAIGHRMIRNLAPVMPILMPAAMLAMVPVLWLSFGSQPTVFYLSIAGFASYAVALIVTLAVEVPIDNQIRAWTANSLPADGDRSATAGNHSTSCEPSRRSQVSD